MAMNDIARHYTVCRHQPAWMYHPDHAGTSSLRSRSPFMYGSG